MNIKINKPFLIALALMLFGLGVSSGIIPQTNNGSTVHAVADCNYSFDYGNPRYHNRDSPFNEADAVLYIDTSCGDYTYEYLASTSAAAAGGWVFQATVGLPTQILLSEESLEDGGDSVSASYGGSATSDSATITINNASEARDRLDAATPDPDAPSIDDRPEAPDEDFFDGPDGEEAERDLDANEEDGVDPSCENSGVVQGWLICSLLLVVDSSLQLADDLIVGLFEIDSRFYDNKEIQGAWANIRNLSYIILVPALLLMVLGTALGFEFVSAYTVKKALPRMIAAIVFIALSYEITVFAVNFTHDISRGISGLVYAPFVVDGSDLTLRSLFNPTGGGGEVVLGNVAALLLVGFATGFMLTGGFFVVLAFIGAAALVLIIVALILALRQMFIIGLILVAPLAILGWIFPGNTKLWGLWRGSFTKLLLIYPIIVFLTAVGRVFAYMISQIIF